MKYIKPSIEVFKIQTVQMLAESKFTSEKTVNGEKALTKENRSWEIWDEE